MNDNSVHLIGRLGKDPESSFTQNGDMVCNFSIAISEYYKKDKTQKDFDVETTWVPITAWRNVAERVAGVAKKGTEVLVVGKLREKKWEDKETVKPRFRMYVLANRVDFGEGRIVQGQGGDETPQPKPEDEKQDKDASDPKKKTKEEEDDLPF